MTWENFAPAVIPHLSLANIGVDQVAVVDGSNIFYDELKKRNDQHEKQQQAVNNVFIRTNMHGPVVVTAFVDTYNSQIIKDLLHTYAKLSPLHNTVFDVFFLVVFVKLCPSEKPCLMRFPKQPHVDRDCTIQMLDGSQTQKKHMFCEIDDFVINRIVLQILHSKPVEKKELMVPVVTTDENARKNPVERATMDVVLRNMGVSLSISMYKLVLVQ